MIKFFQIIILTITPISLAQMIKTHRRIINGEEVTEDKSYIVYLTKANNSIEEYDFWICGGAIVSEWFILTSAACVEDVKHMFAIAGYRTYIPNRDIDLNACTKTLKKRIIFTCVPKSQAFKILNERRPFLVHEFDPERVEKWAQIDIAVAKVETKFDFKAPALYKSVCHYIPQKIDINYDRKVTLPGLDVQIYGWGHSEKWRKPEDKKDYNQDTLRYAATTLYDKEICKAYFKDYRDLDKIIDRYMICTMEPGNINDVGRQILRFEPSIEGCLPIPINENSSFCKEDEAVAYDYRRHNVLSRILWRQQNGRKQGICQNDHGGPLVAFVGGKEILLGIASVFRVTRDSKCTGPYLYTSTDCNSAFLDCILTTNLSRRYDICNRSPSEKGFDIVEAHISWRDHPDGPAENEQLEYKYDEEETEVQGPKNPLQNIPTDQNHPSLEQYYDNNNMNYNDYYELNEQNLPNPSSVNNEQNYDQKENADYAHNDQNQPFAELDSDYEFIEEARPRSTGYKIYRRSEPKETHILYDSRPFSNEERQT